MCDFRIFYGKKMHKVKTPIKPFVMTNRFFSPLSVVMLLMLTVACHDSHYEEDVDSVDFVTDIAHNEADTMIVNTTTQQTIVLQHCRALEQAILDNVPTNLNHKWRWVGIGKRSQYKPVFSWRGNSMFTVAFQYDGSIDIHDGSNAIDGSYTAGERALRIQMGMSTLVGNLSKTLSIYEMSFKQYLSNAKAYNIDSEGLLRIYYSDTDYILLAAADAVGDQVSSCPTKKELVGRWILKSVAYGNGTYSFKDEGIVLFNDDGTMETRGSGSLLVRSLADGIYTYDYHAGTLAIDNRQYNVSTEGNYIYLCGGLALNEPTIVMYEDGHTN